MINNPTLKSEVAALYRGACGGDESAFEFLVVFDQYFEALRAFVAQPGSSRELIDLFAKTNVVYSLRFYAQNGSTLRLTIEGALSRLAAPDGDLALGAVILAVASLTGGFSQAQALSLAVNELLLSARPAQKD